MRIATMLRVMFAAFVLAVFAGCGVTSGSGSSQNSSGTSTSSGLPGTYLMAFHACDNAATTCTQSQNHYTYIASSNDGTSWTPLPNFTPFRGSVPDIVVRGQTLYIYNPDPDKVTRYSSSNGTTQSENITVTMSDGTADDLGDVAPYLDPATNKIVIFYKSTKGYADDPAKCTTCPIRSATEVDGSDGARFTTDNGDRRPAGDTIADSDIFFDGSRYILYRGALESSQSPKGKVYVYTSDTLKGTYTPIATLTDGVLTESGTVPQGYFDSASGKYWTYITVLAQGGGTSVIKRAVHADFSKVLTDADFTTVISGSTYPGLSSTYMVQSPGFAVNK